MDSNPEKDLLRPAKVAKLFDVSVSTIYLWISTGQLEAVRPAGKTLRISKTAVHELLKKIVD